MRHSGFDLSKLSPKMQEEARRQLGLSPDKPLVLEETPGKRVRQSRDKLNKLELRYADYLRVKFSGHEIRAQDIRLKLANGIWYKPDFVIPSLGLLFEVKGPKAFRGGFENLKLCAQQHKWLRCFLVWAEKGEWFKQEILP